MTGTQIAFCFFQAEDGIRDLTVTGVQTCALPIFRARPARRDAPGQGVLSRLTVPAAPGVRSVAAAPRRGEHSAAKPRFDSMTAAEFRRIALSLPQASQAAHMGHPDFRVAGRIFATLGYPRNGWGMVKLTPEQQELFVRAQPAVFAPVKGGWGRGGATNVRLRAARKGAVREALITAWRNRAPKRLAESILDT